METEGILKLIHSNLHKTIESLSTLNKTRGEAIYRSGQVLICEVFTEPKKSCRVDAKVQGSVRLPYNVVLRFDENGILTDRYCNCPAYAKSDARGKEKNTSICKHCAAVLYYMQADIKSCKLFGAKRIRDPLAEFEKLLGDAPKKEGGARKVKTDIFGARMIEKFEKEATKSEMLSIVPTELSLVPSLTIDRGDQCYLEFTIGNGRQYIVRDVYAMGRAFINHSIIDYGKGLSVFFDTDCFDSDSAKLADFLVKLIDTDKQYYQKISGVSMVSNELRRIFIPLCMLGEFMEVMDGRQIAYHGIKDNYKSITLHAEPPPVMFTAEKRDDGIEMSHNLGNFRLLDNSAANEYFVITADGADAVSMYYNTGRSAAVIAPVLDAFKKNTNQERLMFSIDSQSKLRKYVIPRLKILGKIESNLSETRGLKNRIKLESKLYIDREYNNGDILTAEIKYKYDEFIFDSGTKEVSLAAARIPRDNVGELQVFYLMKELGFYSDSNGKLTLSGDDRIYEFLSAGLSRLGEYAEVFVTDAVKKIYVRRPKSPTVKIKLQGGLVEMAIGSDLPPSEISEILAAYREKKNYFRLKDGSFLALEDSNIGFLSELERNFELDAEKLKKRELTFPAYRSIYLKSLMNKYPDTELSGNKAFKTLTDGIIDCKKTEELELDSGLREYQKTGVRWLKCIANYALGGILADEMGLGKTIQIISLIALTKDEPRKRKQSLVVAPTSLVYNWKTEFSRFAPQIETTVISGTVAKRHEMLQAFKGDVIITSYDALKRDIELYENKKFRYVIIDEAQYIKNQSTQAAISVKTLNSETRFALTGTPIENSLSDLWSIFDFVLPGYLYNYSNFRRKYEIPIIRDNDQAVMATLLEQVKPFILRRTKKEVLKELPEKIESTVYVEMEEEQRLVYVANLARAKEELESEIEKFGFDRSRIKILSLITRLRHLCCHPALFLENYEGGSSKLELCMELVQDSISEGHKVLIFSQFVSMLAIIGEELKKMKVPYFLLKGDTPSEERLKLVDNFNSGTTPIFLISLRAGGTGLNLTSADVVIHYDPWWNLSVQNQATDRAHRIGQQNTVQVFKLLVKDSIEDKINELQQKKESISRTVITENETFISNMNREDMLGLFSD